MANDLQNRSAVILTFDPLAIPQFCFIFYLGKGSQASMQVRALSRSLLATFYS
jgi:hypothetical protein